jgi:hypothetical protein
VVACALAYVAGSAWILWFSLAEGPFTLVWLAVVTAAAGIAYAATLRQQRAARALAREEPPA